MIHKAHGIRGQYAPYPSQPYDNDYFFYPTLSLFVATYDRTKKASEADAWDKTSVAADPSDPSDPPSPAEPITKTVAAYFRDTHEWFDVPVPNLREKLGSSFTAHTILLLKKCVLVTMCYNTSRDT